MYCEVNPDAGPVLDVTQMVYSPYGYLKDAMAQTSYDPVRLQGLSSLDPLTKVYHLGDGNRVYDPAMMRFLQYDPNSPFGSGGINPYAYCSGDPVTFSDPSGSARTDAIVIGTIGLILSLFFFGFAVAAIAAGAITALAVVRRCGRRARSGRAAPPALRLRLWMTQRLLLI